MINNRFSIIIYLFALMQGLQIVAQDSFPVDHFDKVDAKYAHYQGLKPASYVAEVVHASKVDSMNTWLNGMHQKYPQVKLTQHQFVPGDSFDDFAYNTLRQRITIPDYVIYPNLSTWYGVHNNPHEFCLLHEVGHVHNDKHDFWMKTRVPVQLGVWIAPLVVMKLLSDYGYKPKWLQSCQEKIKQWYASRSKAAQNLIDGVVFSCAMAGCVSWMLMSQLYLNAKYRQHDEKMADVFAAKHLDAKGLQDAIAFFKGEQAKELEQAPKSMYQAWCDNEYHYPSTQWRIENLEKALVAKK